MAPAVGFPDEIHGHRVVLTNGETLFAPCRVSIGSVLHEAGLSGQFTLLARLLLKTLSDGSMVLGHEVPHVVFPTHIVATHFCKLLKTTNAHIENGTIYGVYFLAEQ